MASRRSSRLVRILPVAILLLLATPGFAAPQVERAASPSWPQRLQELWSELTDRFAGLIATGTPEPALLRSSDQGTSEPATADDPLVQPQLGKDDDPDG